MTAGTRGSAIGLLLAVALPISAGAQTLRGFAFGAFVTNAEVNRGSQAEGFGGGGTLEADVWRLHLQLAGLHAPVSGSSGSGVDYSITQLDGSAVYLVRPYFGVEAGAGRRFVSPDFRAQEVGWLRAGLWSNLSLTRIARVLLRGALLPGAEFSGGGDGGLGVEIGLGATVGSPTGRVEGVADFQFQHFGRTVAGLDVPTQFSVSRVGVRLRL